MNFCVPEFLLVGQLLRDDPSMMNYTCGSFAADGSAGTGRCSPKKPNSRGLSGGAKGRNPKSNLRAAHILCPIEEEETDMSAAAGEDNSSSDRSGDQLISEEAPPSSPSSSSSSSSSSAAAAAASSLSASSSPQITSNQDH